MVFLAFLLFSSSPPADTSMKNAHTAINKNPNAASICRRSTTGENILTQNCQPRPLPTVSHTFVRIRVFHTENAICITNIPIDTQMILRFHFLTSSSSLDEKRSLITPMMRNNTATAIKKFLILNAILVNAPSTPFLPVSPGEKKNPRIGETKSFNILLDPLVTPMATSRTLGSSGAAERRVQLATKIHREITSR